MPENFNSQMKQNLFCLSPKTNFYGAQKQMKQIATAMQIICLFVFDTTLLQCKDLLRTRKLCQLQVPKQRALVLIAGYFMAGPNQAGPEPNGAIGPWDPESCPLKMIIGQVADAQLLVRIVASRTGLEHMTIGTKVECAKDVLFLV